MKTSPAEVRFEVKVTPAQFDKIARLAVSLDVFPERREAILDILTEAWSANGGFFIPSIAREMVVDEIKLIVVAALDRGDADHG